MRRFLVGLWAVASALVVGVGSTLGGFRVLEHALPALTAPTIAMPAGTERTSRPPPPSGDGGEPAPASGLA